MDREFQPAGNGASRGFTLVALPVAAAIVADRLRPLPAALAKVGAQLFWLTSIGVRGESTDQRCRFPHGRTLLNSVLAGLAPGLLGAWVCCAAPAAELTVFAAASLSDALKEIGDAYAKQAGVRIIFNFGGSSTLARQIAEGAPADLFFSADETGMDALEKRGLILKETRKSRLSNSLVIVVAADSHLPIQSAKDLAGERVKRVALADPQAVPAGIYSRKYLEKLKLWPAVERKVVPTENVRAALAAVAAGNVEAGMVYKTDAAISTKVRVACEVKAEEGPPISYPIAVVKESGRIESAKRFLRYLDAGETRRVFERYGFVVRE